MTFLCEQPNFDGSNMIHTLIVNFEESTIEDKEEDNIYANPPRDDLKEMMLTIFKRRPTDEDKKNLWTKVKNKNEAENLVVESILKECEKIEPNWIAASSKIAARTRRHRGNIIITNPADINVYNIKMDAIFYRKDIPVGTGIVLYKGVGEVDGGFYFSQGAEETMLYFTPEWKNYAMLFNTTVIDI